MDQTKRQKIWDREAMMKAVKALRGKEMGLLEALKTYMKYHDQPLVITSTQK
jgi:hypothetical protein